jgi:alkaline phosphatase D
LRQLGDIVYADAPVFLKVRIPADVPRLQRHYAAQRANPLYAAFAASTPVVGVYDDHDAGTNDADRHANPVTRAAAQQLLLDFLDEPADSPRRRHDGAYAVHVWGQPPTQVRLLLLDNRMHRDR